MFALELSPAQRRESGGRSSKMILPTICGVSMLSLGKRCE